MWWEKRRAWTWREQRSREHGAGKGAEIVRETAWMFRQRPSGRPSCRRRRTRGWRTRTASLRAPRSARPRAEHCARRPIVSVRNVVTSTGKRGKRQKSAASARKAREAPEKCGKHAQL
eukprot:5722543-Pleurochrysis_carterae.AAC.1